MSKVYRVSKKCIAMVDVRADSEEEALKKAAQVDPDDQALYWDVDEVVDVEEETDA